MGPIAINNCSIAATCIFDCSGLTSLISFLKIGVERPRRRRRRNRLLVEWPLWAPRSPTIPPSWPETPPSYPTASVSPSPPPPPPPPLHQPCPAWSPHAGLLPPGSNKPLFSHLLSPSHNRYPNLAVNAEKCHKEAGRGVKGVKPSTFMPETYNPLGSTCSAILGQFSIWSFRRCFYPTPLSMDLETGH